MTSQINKLKNILSPASCGTDKNSGVTLFLSLLILSAILAIAFSIASILFIEVRNSAEILKGETAFYAASALTEEALFKIKRQVPNCGGGITNNCYSGYPGKVGSVDLSNPSPFESSTSTPIFNDIIPTYSNNFPSANRYSLYNVNDVAGGSGYGRIRLSYLDSNNNDPLIVYVCEYDPSFAGQYATPGPACSDPSSENNYWYPNGNFVNNVVMNPGSVPLDITLDPSKQQELVVYNGAASPSGQIYVQIESYADQAGTIAKGIPLIGLTSVDITAKISGLTRKIRVNVPNSPPPALPNIVRINAGGNAYTSGSGNVFSADTGYSGGFSFSVGNSIANTTDDTLYQTSRWHNTTFSYQFPISNGSKTVRLRFAEPWFGVFVGGGAGLRVFDIYINGVLVQDNFDIYQEAGGALRATDKEYSVNIINGQVTVELRPVISNPTVSAIEIF